jgi:hypothetical protein
MRKVTDTKFSQLSKWSEIMHRVKQIDLFGRPIGLTYQYEETFKTVEGAILTIMIMMAMISVTGIYFHNMINRTEQILNSKVQYVDLTNDIDPIIFTGD